MNSHSKKLIASGLIVFILIAMPQVTNAGGVVSAIASAATSVVNTVVNVAKATTTAVVNVGVDGYNGVVGAVKDVAGGVTWVAGTVTKNQATIDSGDALFKSAAGNYENAVNNLSSVNNLTNSNAYIGSSDAENCHTDSSVILVGSTGTWTGEGGNVGATFDFGGTNNFSQTVTQETFNGTLSASHVYTAPGVQTANVHWADKSQSGNISCSGSITVVATPAQLPGNQQNQNGQAQNGSNGNGSGSSTNPNGINGIGGNLGNALGSITNPILLNSLCSAVQLGSASGSIYVNKSMTWSIAPQNLPVLTGLNVTWGGSDIASVKTSALNLSKIYTTIGQKTISISLSGADSAGTYYGAVCNATTTVKAPVTTEQQI